MKKYRSFALICALALTLTGCKAQSIDSNSGGAASAPTVEADTDTDMQTTTAAITTAATTTAATTAETTTTEATTVTEPESFEPIMLQSYTVGSALAEFTFDAPEGLEFEEQSSSIAEQAMFESYAYNEAYTIGVLQVDFDYTLGQPQALLDFLGFPGDFGIKTEFFSETTENGTAYDLVVLELYTDENMQECSAAGMVGLYPMQNGVLFFGYEINSQENYDYYYSTQKQTLNSLVISENAYTQPEAPDSELSGELQTVVCEEHNCTFPVLKEFEYWEDGDAATMWSGMTEDCDNTVVAGYEADVNYKDVFSELNYSYDNINMVLSSEYMYTYDGKDFGFVEIALLNRDDETTDYTCLYAAYEADGGTYIISYTFTDECDEETKALVIEAFKGFKISE